MKYIYVITISDGNEEDLKFTIESIKTQKYKFYKHIIIVKKLSKNFMKRNKTNKIFYIVGKDKSLYNAMNLGVNVSKKYYTIYINAGDSFFSNTSLSLINKKLSTKKFFNAQFVSVLKYKNYFFYPKKKFFFDEDTLAHNSFVRAPIKDKKVLFNEELTITADGKWMKENIKLNGLKRFYIPLSIFTLGGQSNLPSIWSILERNKLGYKSSFKEVIKYIFVKFLGKKLFYILIYSKKYHIKK